MGSVQHGKDHLEPRPSDVGCKSSARGRTFFYKVPSKGSENMGCRRRKLKPPSSTSVMERRTMESPYIFFLI